MIVVTLTWMVKENKGFSLTLSHLFFLLDLGQDDDNDAEEADEDGETPLIDRPEEPQDVEVKVPSKPKLAGPKTNSMLDDHMKVVSRLEANSSFMGYLVISALIVLVLYLMYHNKKKVS